MILPASPCRRISRVEATFRDRRNSVVNSSSEGKVDSSRASLRRQRHDERSPATARCCTPAAGPAAIVGSGMIRVARIATRPIARMMLVYEANGMFRRPSSPARQDLLLWIDLKPYDLLITIIDYLRLTGRHAAHPWRPRPMRGADDLPDPHGEAVVDDHHVDLRELGVFQVQVGGRLDRLLELSTEPGPSCRSRRTGIWVAPSTTEIGTSMSSRISNWPVPATRRPAAPPGTRRSGPASSCHRPAAASRSDPAGSGFLRVRLRYRAWLFYPFFGLILEAVCRACGRSGRRPAASSWDS